MVSSALDGIPGLGEARKKKVIKSFGGVNAVKKATLEELQAQSWLPEEVAQAIYNKFHGS
jgi:excinuclease ABC subunit C